MRIAEKTGLTKALSMALARCRTPLVIHDPATIVMGLAVAVAIGGDCVADINQLCAEPTVSGRAASDPTVSRAVTAVAGDQCCGLPHLS